MPFLKINTFADDGRPFDKQQRFVDDDEVVAIINSAKELTVLARALAAGILPSDSSALHSALNDLETALAEAKLIDDMSGEPLPDLSVERWDVDETATEASESETIQNMADAMFGTDDEPRRDIEVRLAARTRSEYIETVSVPVRCTDDELDKLVDRAWDDLPTAGFEVDADYWDRSIDTGWRED